MRPSRIIVGEVRQAESLDLLIALNSGLPGMCTIHANSAREAVTKMCTLPLLAGENVGSRFVVPTVAGSIDLVVHATEDELAQMDSFVTQMHAKAGLDKEIRESTTSIGEAEDAVLALINEHCDPEHPAPLAGNSIATDRTFIRAYMPRLDSALHYRMIDVSTIKELARRWHPRAYFNQPDKGMAHRALADIIDIVFAARPNAISLEACNPRHDHEWALFEEVELPEGYWIEYGGTFEQLQSAVRLDGLRRRRDGRGGGGRRHRPRPHQRAAERALPRGDGRALPRAGEARRRGRRIHGGR